MNTRYETGNVIRNATTFGDYKFPNELPTEEWAGNEVRTYQNYIRPVANLFENDRENLGLIKDIYKSLNPLAENAVISGCDVVRTEGTDYYEVQHGAFVKDGVLYYVYPACEAVAQQLESEFTEKGLGTLRLKITYDYKSNIYSYSIIVNSGEERTGQTNNTGAALIGGLISLLFRYIPLNPESSVIPNPPVIEDHILLPFFNIAANVSKDIFFDDNAIQAGTRTQNSVLFATVTNGSVNNNVKTKTTIDGSRVKTQTIANDSINTPWIKIGTTQINLGASSADFTDVNTINGVNISSTSGLKITGSGSAKITTTADYTLDTACTKAFTTDTTLASNGETAKLPTASTVKTYVDNRIQDTVRTGTINFDGIKANSASFANTVSLTNNNSRIIVNGNADASGTASAVSGTASIYTKGGIEAEKNIYSKANIVGLNNGTYSLRKLKENITPFRKSAVKLINDVKIVNYNYIADVEKNPKVGFIADDTDELFSTKNHNIMDQSNCIGILLKAVQELSNEVKKLKEEINDLKSGNGKE